MINILIKQFNEIGPKTVYHFNRRGLVYSANRAVHLNNNKKVCTKRLVPIFELIDYL